VISLDFARKKKFKLKKIERLMYIRSVDEMFNEERLIKHTMEVNIHY